MAPVTYTVEVTREDDAWIADVIDLPGAHTFARNLTALDDAIHEVIELVIDAPEGAPRPDLHYVYLGVDETFTNAAKLGEERDAAERKQRELAAAASRTAAALAAAGFSVRDIAGVLKMSPGRVSQILSSRTAANESNNVATRPKPMTAVRSVNKGATSRRSTSRSSGRTQNPIT